MRYVTSELIRFFNEESKMAFIAGPRQVGKTTLAKYFLDLKKAESFYFNWDIDSHQKNIISHPEDFWKRVVVTPTKGKQRISLDEIHKYPRWKRFLKGLYDDQKDELEIIVTGSGRLDLYQKGGDSLFGRYHLYHLYPFTVGELISTNRETVCSPENFWGILLEGEGKKNTEESLKAIETFTGFPEPLFSENIKHLHRWRQDHKKLVIREDLRDLTRIREIGILEILVSLLPERIGSPISINALREDLGVNFLTVQGWLEALERLYYIFKLRPYSGKLARTLRREEKIYLFDYSVIENNGAKFENVVALHLLKLCSVWTEWGFGDFSLFYTRDRDKRETDFLITESHKPYALIEAKLSVGDIDPNLIYFSERLKPKYTVQIVREPKKFKSIVISNRTILIDAGRFLSLI